MNNVHCHFHTNAQKNAWSKLYEVFIVQNQRQQQCGIFTACFLLHTYAFFAGSKWQTMVNLILIDNNVKIQTTIFFKKVAVKKLEK